jgi:hypothetical protein
VEGEKQHRFKELESILKGFERNLQQISDTKAEKYDVI